MSPSDADPRGSSGRPPADYSDLRALLLNCTLKRSPLGSNTEGLLRVPAGIFRANGVDVEIVRVADLTIPPGVQLDMTGYGYERDDWPALQAKVMAADILIVGTPNQPERWAAGERFDHPGRPAGL